ncbi:ribosome-releasing factor 2, mitochondrial-like [Uloborus diversus]|uniref:ribosome-releasing factor 2, mitochondrial-like n=1 Tax=Uloborus diversus TaxID=327109 RepID=UPI002408FB84|nr:ribosome-releasing factor 2, mitochondrial-like [Uloborus diversus]
MFCWHTQFTILRKYFIDRYFQNSVQFRYVTKLVKDTDIKKIRNIGIIAHIDAGKTTTTERMLYYSGLTTSMGEVHDGDTVMDYMAQERERGITITSAAVTFNWKKHKINLIDTPGHVDFTFEVERSVFALDGAITILDSSAGVEVQTLKVWEQARRYEVPCIIYLNKMDKPAADLDMCLTSLVQKLKVQPLQLHIPVGCGKDFRGVIDVLSMQKIVWDSSNSDGTNFIVQNIGEGKESSLLKEKREQLIETVADLDDEIGEIYITKGTDALSFDDLCSAIRRITLKRLAVPVFCGSSYKNKGVQLLLDAVITYLPNPSERKLNFTSMYKDTCALVFKIIHSKNKEPLTFVRAYSGQLKSGQKVYNVDHQCSEKIEKIMVASADDFHEVSSLSAGNIGVITGFKNAVTGDILTASASSLKKDPEACSTYSVQIPDPVFFCTIEPPSVGQQKTLDFALQCLQREDPTLHVEVDEAIGQTILMGMGELHIDVVKQRIKTEYGIDAYLGPLQVAYREALRTKVSNIHVLDKTLSGNKQFVKLELELYPCNKTELLKEVKIVVTKENNLGKIRPDYLKAINTGMKNAFQNGPLLNFPVLDVAVNLLWLEVGKGTSLSMISAATSQCISSALRKGSVHLLEPIMFLSIVVNKGYAGQVINDLSQKRSQILNMELRQDVEVIESKTPLSELRGYSSHLRALTAGTCSFTMEFDSYQEMEPQEQAKVVQNLTGFY